MSFCLRTVSASSLLLKNCRLRPLPIFGQVTHQKSCLLCEPPLTLVLIFTLVSLIAVLRMIANAYATDKTADRNFVKEVSSRAILLGGPTRLKIRWALKGPCRFESGHRHAHRSDLARRTCLESVIYGCRDA